MCGMTATYSQPFPVTIGVKQGCVQAPTLFSMVLSALRTYAFRNGGIGVGFSYRTDGKLLKIAGKDKCA